MIDDAWVVGDMDEGIVFGAATKRQCVAWIEWRGTPIYRTKRYRPGDYEYALGYPDEDDSDTLWVMTNAISRAHAFDPDEDVRHCSSCQGFSRHENNAWTCKTCGHEQDTKDVRS